MMPAVRDQRGAIMVIGLFMATFTTGGLLYMISLGEAIAQRERMQDAADAAAFSAAVLHARGMNAIALVNMTMAALLAVLIALKLVELAGYLGVAIATGLAFFTSGASLSAVPPFTQIAISAREAHEAAQPAVHTSLRALRIAARGVRVVMPWVAQARTVQLVADHYAPPALAGFAVPARVTLPTRDGSYADLCRKAGEYVGDLIDVPFEGLRLPGFSIGEVTGGLIGTGSAYFCEANGGHRPSTWLERKVWHPVLPRARECEAYAQRSDVDAAEHERVCARADRQAEVADDAIHPQTGACVESAESDCGLDGLYELRASLAQPACAPRATGDDALSTFTWQARSFSRRYTWDDGEWKVELEVVPGTERYALQKTPWRPCGSPHRGISPAWNGARRRDGELVPICDDVAPPSTPPVGHEHTVDVPHTEVLQIFRCLELTKERREVEGEGGGLAASDEDGQHMAPQRMAEDARLGEEDFQIRAVVVGSDASAPANTLLGRLLSGEAGVNPLHTAPWRAASALGRVAVAQAEHYFDDATAGSGDMLWSMRWTARLRRFRVAEQEPEPAQPDDLADAALHDVTAVHTTFESACAALAPKDFPCGAIDLSFVSELSAH